MNLSEEQKIRIHNAFESNRLDFEAEIENLINQGFTRENAILKIKEELESHKQTLFEKALKSENKEEMRKAMHIVIIILSLIGPTFSVSSPFWYILAVFTAGGLGYLAYSDQPVAGIFGSICLVVVFPFMYSWYISGRSSIITIELLIPMGISMGISYFIGWLITRLDLLAATERDGCKFCIEQGKFCSHSRPLRRKI